MASFLRQKEALRGALFAFLAGAHNVIEEVEKAQSISAGGGTPEAIEMRHAMLEADYERLLESPQTIELFVETLDEEDLYPFGSEWPREEISLLMTKVIPPKLSITDSEAERRFRFKKGFKELLVDLAGNIESHKRHQSTLDHWMVLLFNTAFHAGATVAARNAENTKLYYSVIPEIEGETEPWTKYTQIADMLDRQLRRETRRKTGLVSDLDSLE